MEFQEFKEYIEQRVSFYKAMSGTWRNDREWDWDAIGSGRYSVRGLVLRSHFGDFARRVLGKDKESALFIKHLAQMYDVRCRLCDEMSRHLLDETIVLRLVGHYRFSSPRSDFSDFLSIISEKDFTDAGLPHDFLGPPLSVFTVSLTGGIDAIGGKPIVMIGHRQLIDITNRWRQYF